MGKKRFWIFTSDHSALPLAIRLQEEGNDVVLTMIRPEEREGKWQPAKDAKEAKSFAERVKYLEKNGKGLVKKMWAKEAINKIGKNDLVIFDQIWGFGYGEALHRRGIKVFGGSQVGHALETERRKTLALLKKLGFDVPMQKYFGKSSAQKGIEFLQNINDEMIFAFKSDNPKITTAVAYDSNDELIQKMTAEAKDIDSDGYLLQQKVEGIEFAVESWYTKGVPIACWIDLECKKQFNEMSEPQTGCAFSLDFTVPVDHPLRERLNKPFDEFVSQYIGTGFLDVSVIYDHYEDKMWVLECCGSRLAYNAFYGSMALCTEPIGEFFADYLSNKFTKDIGSTLFMPDRYAASLRVFNHECTPDQHINFPKEYRDSIWLWDCFLSGGKLLTVGTPTGESIGIITATGENPEAAFAEIRKLFYKIQMPTKYARDDFDEEDSPGLVLNRFHRMQRLKLL